MWEGRGQNGSVGVDPSPMFRPGVISCTLLCSPSSAALSTEHFCTFVAVTPPEVGVRATRTAEGLG